MQPHSLLFAPSQVPPMQCPSTLGNASHCTCARLGCHISHRLTFGPFGLALLIWAAPLFTYMYIYIYYVMGVNIIVGMLQPPRQSLASWAHEPDADPCTWLRRHVSVSRKPAQLICSPHSLRHNLSAKVSLLWDSQLTNIRTSWSFSNDMQSQMRCSGHCFTGTKSLFTVNEDAKDINYTIISCHVI